MCGMVDLRQPNTSFITTQPDQLITVTTQAVQENRRLRLGITSSPDGPDLSRLGCIERLIAIGLQGDVVGNGDFG